MKHILVATAIVGTAALHGLVHAEEPKPAVEAAPTPRPNPIKPIMDIMTENETAELHKIWGETSTRQKAAIAANDEAARRAAAVKCYDDEVVLFKKVIDRVKAAGGNTAKAQEATDTFIAKKDEMVTNILKSVAPIKKD